MSSQGSLQIYLVVDDPNEVSGGTIVANVNRFIDARDSFDRELSLDIKIMIVDLHD